MLDQIAERNRLGDLERALDLVHHLQALGFHRLGDIDMRIRSGPAPDIVAVHGRVQRMQLQFGIAKPVAQLGDLRAIAIVQVLARAENLHRRDARLMDLIQPDGGQPMIHEQVRRQNVMHPV